MKAAPFRLCLAAVLGGIAVAPATAARENVLVIVADDVGVDNVGAYGEGADPPPTPNIDALAATGVLFRNAWANPVCSPTRATILSGRYGFRTGVQFIVPPNPELRFDETLIPEVLDANPSLGYSHAAIGKWHLGRTTHGDLSPNVHGFSHFSGAFEGVLENYYDWPKTTDGVTTQVDRYATSENVDDALVWIAGQTGPWFLYLAFNAAHTPFDTPPPSLHTQTLPAAAWRNDPRPYYRAIVEAMDTEIGRLLGSLPPPVRSATNVIFIGDNGTPFYVTEPPFDPAHAKGTLYEGGVNVPLIIDGPRVVEGGRESAALVNSTDLFATVLEMAGVDVAAGLPSGADSMSLLPLLTDPSLDTVRTLAIAEMVGYPGYWIGRSGVALRNERYKLIAFYDGGVELYDLATDPFEQNNLVP